MIKKVVTLLLVVLVIFSVAACTGTTPVTEDTSNTTEDTSNTTEDTSNTTETTSSDTSESTKEDAEYLKLRWTYCNDTQTGFDLPSVYPNYFETTLIWDCLLRYDYVAEEYVCAIADSYTYNDDGSVWTVVLKDDVCFHDGEKVTADDVIFTYNFVALSSGFGASGLANIVGYDELMDGSADTMEGIHATDDKTIVFEFKEEGGTLDFETYLSHGGLAILPEHMLGSLDWTEVANDGYWAKPVGCGPYYVDETNYPNYVTLKRFDDYYGKPAGIENILLTYYADDEAFLAACVAGEADLYYTISSDNADYVISQNSDYEMVTAGSNYCRQIWVNGDRDTGFADLANPTVRQAFSLILDKQAIVDLVGPLADVATNLTPSNSSDYNTDIPVFQRNVAKAVAMLESVDYDFDHVINLYTYYEDQQTVDIMDMIVEQFAEAGITVEYYNDGTNTNTILYETMDWELAYGGGCNPGIMTYCELFPGNTKDVWYTDEVNQIRQEKFLDLYNQYSSVKDPTVRKEIFDEFQVNFMEEMLFIPVWFRNTAWLVNSSHLSGFIPYSADFAIYAYLGVENWSLNP